MSIVLWWLRGGFGAAGGILSNYSEADPFSLTSSRPLAVKLFLTSSLLADADKVHPEVKEAVFLPHILWPTSPYPGLKSGLGSVERGLHRHVPLLFYLKDTGNIFCSELLVH